MFHLFLVLMLSIHQGRGLAAPSVNTDDQWAAEDRGTLFYMRYYASYSYVNPMNLAFLLSCVLWVFSISFILWSSPQSSAVRGAAGMDVVMLTEPENIWNCQKCVSYASDVSDLFASYELCDVWVYGTHVLIPARKTPEAWPARKTPEVRVVSWACESTAAIVDSCPHTHPHIVLTDIDTHLYAHTLALCAISWESYWWEVSRWKRATSLSLETCMSAHVILMSLLSLLILMFLMFLRFLMSMCVCVA